MLHLKQSTASQSVVIGPFVDSTDGNTAETGLTVANTDIRLSKNGANIVGKNSGGGTHDEIGYYTITLDATDTNTVGRLQLMAHVSGALPVYHEYEVLEEAVYDGIYGASAVGPLLASTTGTGLSAIPWNAAWDAEVQSEAADALTAYDPPTNTEMEARTLVAANYATAANLATVDTVVDSILVDTAEIGTAGAGLTALASAANLATVAGYLDTEIAAILADTNELQTDWANGGRLDLILDARASQTSVDTIDDLLDTEVAAILADTNELQTDWANGGRLDLILDARASQSSVDALTVGASPDVLADTTIATLATQTSFTLTAGSADDDAYNGMAAIFTDQSTSAQKWLCFVSDYTGSTKTVTLEAAPGFTIAEGDSIAIMAAGGSTSVPVPVNVTQIEGVDATDQLDAHAAAGLDAAGVRAAIGLASANLDTQLADLPTVAEFEARTLVAANYATAANLATVDTVVDSILVDTAEIGAAGAGLTTLASAANLAALPSDVWDEARAGHAAAGTFGEGISSVQGNVTGSVASVTGAVGSVTGAVGSVTGAVGSVTGAVGSVTGAVGSVTGNVGGNVTGSVGSVAAGGITASSIGTGAIDADALTTDAVTEIADAVLDRNMATGTDSGSPTVRTMRQALRALRNKVSIAAGTATITKEDDATASWTAAVTTTAGDPISSIDPAS